MNTLPVELIKKILEPFTQWERRYCLLTNQYLYNVVVYEAKSVKAACTDLIKNDMSITFFIRYPREYEYYCYYSQNDEIILALCDTNEQLVLYSKHYSSYVIQCYNELNIHFIKNNYIIIIKALVTSGELELAKALFETGAIATSLFLYAVMPLDNVEMFKYLKRSFRDIANEIVRYKCINIMKYILDTTLIVTEEMFIACCQIGTLDMIYSMYGRVNVEVTIMKRLITSSYKVEYYEEITLKWFNCSAAEFLKRHFTEYARMFTSACCVGDDNLVRILLSEEFDLSKMLNGSICLCCKTKPNYTYWDVMLKYYARVDNSPFVAMALEHVDADYVIKHALYMACDHNRVANMKLLLTRLTLSRELFNDLIEKACMYLSIDTLEYLVQIGKSKGYKYKCPVKPNYYGVHASFTTDIVRKCLEDIQ